MGTDNDNSIRGDVIALALRVGLGLVFIIGGWSKLSQLLDPAREAIILATYMSPLGYINAFFADYLFSGPLGTFLTPWIFLTALSAFEFLSGAALVAGLLVRPLALLWGLLLWTFVMALPVTTSAGVTPLVDTYTSPALLVQIRDVGLSGLMFVLYNLGPGALSADKRLFAVSSTAAEVSWDNLGLLMRLSVAAPLIVGGAFAGLDHIQSFATAPLALLALGIALATGTGVRVMGVMIAAVMLWYISTRLSFDATMIANLNGVKRELPFVVVGAVLAYAGGGARFTAKSALTPLWNCMSVLLKFRATGDCAAARRQLAR